MKLVEALATLKLTEKKLNQRIDFIKRYAARPSFREDAFGKAGAEALKVKEAVQSCLDLVAQHEELKRNIDYTNLATMVEVAGRNYSIHSLIQNKRELIKLKRRIYAALDDSQAQRDVEQLRMRTDKESKINTQVVYGYDIQEKENALLALTELESQIDSALQIANAKIDVVEAPKPEKR